MWAGVHGNVPTVAALITLYRVKFAVEIVIYGGCPGSLREIATSETVSYVTMSNATELFEYVSKSFTVKKKILVVSENLESILHHRQLLDTYSSTFGLSRWVLRVSEMDSDSIRTQFPRFFLCLTIFLRGNVADFPADFVNCSLRNKISAKLGNAAEAFRRDNLATICVVGCIKEDLESYLRLATSYLNVSSWSIDSLPVLNYKQETFKSLNERSSMICLQLYAFNPERFSLVTMSFPHTFGGYIFASWRQRSDALGSKGLTQIFDSWVWLSLSSMAVGHLLLSVCLFGREFSSALMSVSSCFLGQPLKVSESSKAWFVNISVLQVSALFLCLVFKNKLTSCLNISIWLTLNDFEDLRYLFQNDMISHVCVRGESYVNTLITSSSNDTDFRYLGEEKARHRVIKRATVLDCFNFVRESRKHAALMYGATTALETTSDRANLHLGTTPKEFTMAGFLQAPWLPFEHDLLRLNLLLSATGVPPVTNYTAFIRSRREAFEPLLEGLKPIPLDHLDIAFFPLAVGLFAGALASLYSSMIRMTHERAVPRFRVSQRHPAHRETLSV